MNIAIFNFNSFNGDDPNDTLELEGTEVTLGINDRGSGHSIVVLPALSSISTRAEMRPLFDRLAPVFRVTTVDWPGFGDLARPRADCEAMSAFLNWFLSEIVQPPHAVVAAGHAATYALYQAANRPGVIDRLVLDRADLARTIADDDGRPTPMVCPCPSSGRSTGVRADPLSAQCQQTDHSEDGKGACLQQS